MTAERSALLGDVCRGYRLFATLGWGDTGDGHISVRDPERTSCFWLLRYGVPFAEAEPDQLVLLDADGNTVEGEGKVNNPAFRIHHPLLTARPDIISVAHTHTPWGTPFSSELRPVEPITQEACFFFEDVALFDDEEVQIQDIAGGERIAQCIGKRHSIILRNHGLVTAGTTVASAIVRFVLLERVCEAHIKAPNAKPISNNAARYAHQDLTRPAAFDNMFRYLTKHHRVY